MNNDLDMASQDPVLHRLFLDSMDSEPVAPPVHQQLVASRQGLARRRRKFVMVSAAAVTLLALMPAVAGHVGRDKEVSERPEEMTEAAMTSTCRDGQQPAAATKALFESGTPEVKVHGTAAEMMRVVMVSADGAYWAECFINLYEGAEVTAGMAVYSTAPGKSNNSGGGYQAGYTCKDLDGPPAPPCSTFMVLYVNRVTEPVAAVAFDTADGHTTTVEPVDGFVMFAYTGDVPDGLPLRAPSQMKMPTWLERVTYLAADGTRLAAADTGSAAWDQLPVDGLPSLRAYTEGFGEKVEDPCTPQYVRGQELTPVDCLTAADIAALPPDARRNIERQLSGDLGEISILVEGEVTEEHGMLRRCRGLPPLNDAPDGATDPKLDPLICSALELMASREIPTGHHYTEEELRELTR